MFFSCFLDLVQQDAKNDFKRSFEKDLFITLALVDDIIMKFMLQYFHGLLSVFLLTFFIDGFELTRGICFG